MPIPLILSDNVLLEARLTGEGIRKQLPEGFTVAGVEVGPAQFEEQSRFLFSFNQPNSLIGILTLLGVLQYAPRSSVNANLLRGASTFDVE